MNYHDFGLLAPQFVRDLYLDPGSGSIILQLVIATLLGGLFVIKGYWGRIKAFVTRQKPESESQHDDEV